MKIDAHNHFWKFDPVRDAWIGDEMAVLQRDYLPTDFGPVLQQNSFDGTIAVQADQSEEETFFLLNLADKNPFVKAVVGWVDLQSENVSERLAFFDRYPTLKGFRHIAQAEPDGFLVSPNFVRGMEALSQTRFTFDLLVFPHQLPAAAELVARFPEQTFVIDHLAKPPIKSGKVDRWAGMIKNIAQHQNTYCKVSGMVTEADWNNWKPTEFRPYLDVVTEAFGVDRLMFGSDYPVCLLAAGYEQVCAIAKTYTEGFSDEDQAKIFGGNAIAFYNI